MSIETTQKWQDFINGIGVEVADVKMQVDDEYKSGKFQIVRHGTQYDRLVETTSEVSGFDAPDIREEGEMPVKANRVKGFDTTITIKDNSSTYDFTYESIKYNKFGSALRNFKAFLMANKLKQDKTSAMILNKGWDTRENYVEMGGGKKTYLNWYGDGKPLFSVAHPSPVVGGSSQSNASSNGITLTSANFDIADQELSFQKAYNDELLSNSGRRKLVVPTELKRTARVIEGSDNLPGTNYNDINVFKGWFDIVESKYFSDRAGLGGSRTAWYLIDEDAHDLEYVDGGDDSLETIVDPKSRVYSVVQHSTYAGAGKHWFGTWGSKGDGNAYAA